MTDEEGFECPNCHEMTRFEQRGKRKYLSCQSCNERVGLSLIPDEYIDITEIEHKGSREHREYHRDHGREKDENHAMPRISTDIEILKDILTSFEVNEKKQRVILSRMNRQGGMSSSELLGLLVGLQIATREVATYISQDYENSLSMRDQMKVDLSNASTYNPYRQPQPQQEQQSPVQDAIMIMRELRDSQPVSQTDSSEIQQLRQENREIREEARKDRELAQKNQLEMMEKNMNQQIDILNQRISDSSGFKDDTYRLIGMGLDKHFSALEKGVTNQIGDGQRLKKTLGNVYDARDNANMKKGKFRSKDGKKASINDDFYGMVPDEYIEDYREPDLTHDEDIPVEDMIRRQPPDYDDDEEDGDVNE